MPARLAQIKCPSSWARVTTAKTKMKDKMVRSITLLNLNTIIRGVIGQAFLGASPVTFRNLMQPF
jgi:hypothetical protein